MSFGDIHSQVKLPKVSWLKFSLHSSNTTSQGSPVCQQGPQDKGSDVLSAKQEVSMVQFFSGQGDFFVASLSGKILSAWLRPFERSWKSAYAKK